MIFYDEKKSSFFSNIHDSTAWFSLFPTGLRFDGSKKNIVSISLSFWKLFLHPLVHDVIILNLGT